MQQRAAFIYLLLSLIVHTDVYAAEPVFQRKPFVHMADKQPLGELIRTFAASQGWSVSLSADLDTSVSARFSMAPQKFWHLLTDNHNLQWYFDGQTMHITPVSEGRTEVLPMNESAFKQFQASMRKLDIGDMRYPVRYDPASGVAILNGPPRLIELASALSGQMEGSDGSNLDWVTRVIPLRHALAADTTVRVGTNDVRLEGVASVVRRVMNVSGGESSADTQSPMKSSDGGVRQESLRPTSVSFDNRTRSDQKHRLDGVMSPRNEPPISSGGNQRSRIQSASNRTPVRVESDAGINAVIVRERAARLPEYLSLIQQLDRPRTLIEIEARMIEVERGELDDLGIDWSVSGSKGSIAANNGVGQGPNDARAPQLVTSLTTGAITQLLARVRLLETQGRAKVVMTPRILTLDSTEAVIENTETAYIKVSGNLEANLFSVSAGSSLRILPSVLVSEEPKRIRLMVTLEDGVFSQATIDNVPVIQRSRIFTQSEIGDGTTLVVGGMSDVRERSTVSGIPGLSKLPGVGGLFGSKTQTSSSRERLYLVTPKIISGSGATHHPVQPSGDGVTPKKINPDSLAQNLLTAKSSLDSPSSAPVINGQDGFISHRRFLPATESPGSSLPMRPDTAIATSLTDRSVFTAQQKRAGKNGLHATDPAGKHGIAPTAQQTSQQSRVTDPWVLER